MCSLHPKNSHDWLCKEGASISSSSNFFSMQMCLVLSMKSRQNLAFFPLPLRPILGPSMSLKVPPEQNVYQKSPPRPPLWQEHTEVTVVFVLLFCYSFCSAQCDSRLHTLPQRRLVTDGQFSLRLSIPNLKTDAANLN